jgi:hypothetical protein
MRSITLIKAAGDTIKVSLHNYGAGVDRLNRRWILDAGNWTCLETGETAHKAHILHRLFGNVSSPSRPSANFAQA